MIVKRDTIRPERDSIQFGVSQDPGCRTLSFFMKTAACVVLCVLTRKHFNRFRFDFHVIPFAF